MLQEMVIEAYEKAEKELGEGSLSELAKHVTGRIVDILNDKEIHTSFNKKTIKRAFEKYIDGDESIGKPSDDTKDYIAMYLDQEGFFDYIKQKGGDEREEKHIVKKTDKVTIINYGKESKFYDGDMNIDGDWNLTIE